MLRGGNNLQDTLRSANDSFEQSVQTEVKADMLSRSAQRPVIDTVAPGTLPDTITVCERDYFAHITFADTGATLRITDKNITQGFPGSYLQSANELKLKQYYTLKEKLRDGLNYSGETLYSDWIIAVVFISALLISVIRSAGSPTIKNLLRPLFLTRQNNKNTSDISVIFTWQSTVINFVAFMNLALFAYYMQRYYNMLPPQFPQLIIWSGIFVLIITAVTVRHIISFLAGNMSGEDSLFREYMLNIYQGYRMAGLVCFILIVLISYTRFLPVGVYFTAGIITVAILYLTRIFTLLLIFIKRHISIFYFILYLCALEILPAVVLLRIVTGFK